MTPYVPDVDDLPDLRLMVDVAEVLQAWRTQGLRSVTVPAESRATAERYHKKLRYFEAPSPYMAIVAVVASLDFIPIEGV